ncbi:SPRY domain-containing SOCS box protein 3 [Teleopsis dalmanni]|uniref:SPRY domain-containing SOCS box protein 3 n=1 Tax=Teleopsis dalmanni TaxID=139649 RepID=UPI000D32BEB6|nr:SPRY domain-containing SOCS box protein 3 [Teleopsis dalmanni]
MTNCIAEIIDVKSSRCPAFCDCNFPNSFTVTNHSGSIADLVQCRCGEDTSNTMHWTWQDAETDISIVGPDITFHPSYSQGTAIVRGDVPLQSGMVHFWEMRVLTFLAGTDVMFGIGTDKFDMNQFKSHFISALGIDTNTWGFSYNGRIQHNGKVEPYGRKFSQGVIVGVYLDRTHGYLEFFLNRRSLGIAYTNIPINPDIKIYPMVCSTAFKTVVRLINATSVPECLQLRAYRALSKQPKALEKIRQMPGLIPITRLYWFLAPPIRFSQRSAENELDIADEAVLSKSRLNRKQKFKDEEIDVDDLHTNAHKIAIQRRASDDANLFLSDCFDEHFHYLF